MTTHCDYCNHAIEPKNAWKYFPPPTDTTNSVQDVCMTCHNRRKIDD